MVIEMSFGMGRSMIKIIRILIVSAVLGGIPLTCFTNRYYENRLASRIERETITIFDNIESQLQIFRNTIRSVESLMIIRQATQTTDEKKSTQLALDTLRTFIDAASLFVLDNRGIMVEGSGMATVGANFQFRTYFQKAMEGQTYVYPALGVHHKSLRMFFSSPLSLQEDGRPSGVVAFSVDMQKLGVLLQSEFSENIYGLIMENGVVFASSMDSLSYKAILPITQAELKVIEDSKQFVGPKVEPADFLITSPDVTVAEKNYVVYRKKFPNTNIELFSLIERDKTLYVAFMLSAYFLYVLIVFLVIDLIITNDRKTRAEKQIIDRNIELETSNQNLQQEIQQRLAAEAKLAESNRRLQSLSITDSLTGLANRRHFDAVLNREYVRHARSGDELSLIMLDIDHFKAYNDNYGHMNGDECLRLVGGVLACNMLRSTDMAARYGGEEFICILPETSRVGALLIAERIRQAIMSLGIDHKGSPVAETVTASLGVVTARCAVDGAFESIVAEADKMLYRAKSEGRNRVVCSPAAITAVSGNSREFPHAD